MAGPLEVVGAAVGVTSLGFQLYDKIDSYLSTVKYYNDDIDAARNKANRLREILRLLESSAQQLRSRESLHWAAINSILSDIRRDIQLLETFLEPLITSVTATKGLKNKLLYPFHQKELVRLQDRIDKLNMMLGQAVQSLELELLGLVAGQVNSIEPKVLTTTTILSELGPKVSNISNLSSVMNSTQAIVTTLDSRSEKSDCRLAHIEDMLQNITDIAPHQSALHSLETQRLAVSRLVSKPGDLRDVCEYMTKPSCTCPSQRSRRTLFDFASVSISSITRKEGEHLSYCPLARVSLIRTSRSVEVAINSFRRMLSKAVIISFSVPMGAGGQSISPQLVIRSAVDGNSAPVYAIMDLLQKGLIRELWPKCKTRFGNLAIRNISSATAFCFIKSCIEKILYLYSKRRAHPYEIDENGNTFFHKWTSFIESFTKLEFLERGYVDFDQLYLITKLLLQVGLPADICNFSSENPIMVLLHSEPNEDWGGICALLSRKAQQETFQPIRPIPKSSLADFRVLRGQYFHATEILGFGPLSMAIVEGDLILVQRLTQKSSTYFMEKTSLNQTPFHLAVLSADIISILMLHGNKPGLHDLDVNGYHVIDYALHLSGQLCINSFLSIECSHCTCSDSLKLLLGSEDCWQSWTRARNGISGSWKWPPTGKVAVTSSQRSRRLLVEEIVRRRTRLKELAECHLSSESLQRLKVDSRYTLDQNAQDVVEELQHNFIHVDSSLITPWMDISMHTVLGTRGHGRELAQSVYDWGFQDLNLTDKTGATILSSACSDWFFPLQWTIWAISHGADFCRSFPRASSAPILEARRHECHGENDQGQIISYVLDNVILLKDSVTIAHVMLRDAGCEHFGDSAENNMALSRILCVVAPQKLFDDCICKCTDIGCDPITLMVLNKWRCFSRRTQSRCTPALIASFLQDFYKGGMIVDFFAWPTLGLALLRALTFETLGVRHTCCKGLAAFEIEEEERYELQQEDRIGLDILETLIFEFEQILRCSRLTFNVFLAKHWVPRMDQALVELDDTRQLQEQKLAAAEVGVAWDKDSLFESPPESLNTDGWFVNQSVCKPIEYWMGRLNAIVPEEGVKLDWDL